MSLPKVTPAPHPDMHWVEAQRQYRERCCDLLNAFHDADSRADEWKLICEHVQAQNAELLAEVSALRSQVPLRVVS